MVVSVHELVNVIEVNKNLLTWNEKNENKKAAHCKFVE